MAPIHSLLDVGAGSGVWMRAALDAGVPVVDGVDGIALTPDQIYVGPSPIRISDLRLPLDLGHRYDVVLCLEVAEHLPSAFAETLVRSLCTHSDLIYFSAAAPGQFGDHHINCQWPAFWQSLFNKYGFVCEDVIRPLIWNDELIEPWYRQNLFRARRSEAHAGGESRILSLIHPDMVPNMALENSIPAQKLIKLNEGLRHPAYYLRLFMKSCMKRIARAGHKTRAI